MSETGKFKTQHEAINFVLKQNCKNLMPFEIILYAIKARKLWKRPSEHQFPSYYQIKLRTVVNRHYKQNYVFEKPDRIKLGNY